MFFSTAPDGYEHVSPHLTRPLRPAGRRGDSRRGLNSPLRPAGWRGRVRRGFKARAGHHGTGPATTWKVISDEEGMRHAAHPFAIQRHQGLGEVAA